MIDGPLCFLHVPKCGGQSVERALEAALPEGSRSPRGVDAECARTVSDIPDLENLPDWVRVQAAFREDEIESLRDHRVVAGHFTLATLSRIAPPAQIATVLREPRARLLSLYLFFRTPRMHEIWADYCGDLLGNALRPFEEFLFEPRIFRATDNQVCRMILSGDRRIPDDGFIADGDAEGIAASALERLDRFGFVGILESGDSLWRGLSRMFGVALEPMRVNESSTPAAQAGQEPIPPFNRVAVLDGLERRTVADRIVYETLVARDWGGAAAGRRWADDALAEQFARFEHVRATPMSEPASPLAVAHGEGGR